MMTGTKKARLNLIDKRFGMLHVIKCVGRKNQRSLWLCKCDCGNECKIIGSYLTRGTKNSCNCLAKKYFRDLTGMKFNKVLILKHIGTNKYKNNIYECRCDCGKGFIAEGSDVKTEKIRSCGCQRYEYKILNRMPIPRALALSIFTDYKNKAKQRKYEFELDKEYFIELIKQNCYYCGASPTNIKKLYNNIINYNGIDRKNNKIGYLKENCVACCKICNQSKHTLTESYFLEWIKRVNQFQNNKEEQKSQWQ